MLDDPSEEGFNQLRESIKEVDCQIKQEAADMAERAEWLEAVLRSDPARFRRALFIVTDEDYARQQAEADALEKWRNNVIKARRLRKEREAHHG